MATLTSQLILSLVDRVTAPVRAVEKSISSLQQKIAQNNRKLDELRGRMVEAAAVGYSLYKAIQAPTQAAMDFESAMADVRKVVDFKDGAAGVEKFGRDLMALSERVPVAADELQKVATAAGQFGLKENEILPYTEMAAKVGVAFDMAAGEISLGMAEIMSGTKMTIPEVKTLTDVINHLSNNSPANARKIFNTTKAIAAQGKSMGFAAQETAAFAAQMAGAGYSEEVAGTTFKNMGRYLTMGSATTKDRRAAMGALGFSPERLAKDMQKDAAGTVVRVMKAIGKLAPDKQASFISRIFGNEAQAVYALTGDIEGLELALKRATDEQEYANSAQKEYESRIKTTEASVQLAQNAFRNLSVAIGMSLLPVVKSTSDGLIPLVQGIRQFVHENEALVRRVIMVTSALIGLRVAAIAAQWGFAWMRGAALMSALAGMKGLRAATSAASFALLPFGRAMGLAAPSARGLAKASVKSSAAILAQKQAAFQAALGVYELARSGKVAGVNAAQAAAGVRAAGLAVTAAQGNMKAANTALAALGPSFFSAAGAARALGVAIKVAFISTGVGAIIAGIVAAGVWIYNNWDGISQMFTSFGQSFMKALGPVAPVVQGVWDGVKGIWDAIVGMLGPIDESGEKWKSWGEALGEVVGGSAKTLIESLQSVYSWLGKIFGFGGDGESGAPAAANDNAAQAGPGAKAVAQAADIQAQITAMAGGWPREARTAIRDYADAIKNGQAVASAEAVGKGVQDALSVTGKPQIDTSQLQSALSLAKQLGETLRSVPGVKAAGAGSEIHTRATGGPVAAAKPYLVGEQGPELFVPRVAGNIVNATETARHLTQRASAASARAGNATANARTPAGGGGSAQVTVNMGGITINGTNMNAQQIRREFSREASLLMRRHFSDGIT